MAMRRPENIPPVEWRGKAETVGQMQAQGWDVVSECLSCGLKMQVNLDHLARLAGPELSLWNARPRCRRLHCDGRVFFRGRVAPLLRHIRLEADWPPGRPPRSAINDLEP